MNPDDLELTLRQALGDRNPEPEELTASDASGLVNLVWSADHSQARVSRSFAPDPQVRAELEEAITQAVSSLMDQSHTVGESVGQALGDALRPSLEVDLASARKDLQEKVDALKEQIQMRRDRLDQKRNRR